MSFDDTQSLREPPLKRRLRLGFVGGGRGGLVGNWHAAGARLSNHWNIVAGALSSDPDRARASGEDWMIAPERAYSDYREMARAEAAREDGIEAVAICTPNWSHYDIAVAFIDAGIHVILDKPMTTRLEDAEALVALSRRAGIRLFMTYPFAHHAMVRQMRHMIRAGDIGQIRQVNVEYLQEWATEPPDPTIQGRAWRQIPEKAGRSSAIGDIGTHAFHLLRYATGLELAELRAEFHICGAPKDLEDTAFVNLRMKGGVPGLLWVTQAAPGQYCGLRLRVWGDRGGLSWDQENPEALKFAPLGQPEHHILRGTGGGVHPAVEQLVHLPRGHGEALTDAWGNLYAEMGIAIAAAVVGHPLPEDFVELPGPEEGAEGVHFVYACADSHEAGGNWVKFSRS
ncbi:MAG: Gfo/Idh/MocA family oxidoreductase [Hyphomicrobiales bacterium]|nr:Gfo/Idh/MocA family oxidoreductase [Hyphomicrobiales bacterium]